MSKYCFSKEQLEDALKKGGSHKAAALILNTSKTTFRQQYLKSLNLCIKCKNNLDKEGLICSSCLLEARNNTKDSLPDTKNCVTCDSVMQRNSDSNISWAKKKKCDSCFKNEAKEYFKQHYEENKEKYLSKSLNKKDYQREYRKSEKGKLRRKISNHKRRVQKITTATDIVSDYIESLFLDENKQCYYCGDKENLTIEHKIPLSRNGTHSEDNIVLACSKCNSKKGIKTDEQYLQIIRSSK